MVVSTLLVVVGLAALPAQQPTTAAPARGQELYRLHCAVCHGPDGEGGRGAVLARRTLRVTDEDGLMALLRDGIPGTEMVPTRMTDEERREVARWVRGLGRSSVPPLPGDPARGARVFAEQANCSTCHAIRGQGGVLGPELTSIGLRRGPAYLRRALTDPSADVPDNFLEYRWYREVPDNFLLVSATMRDGRSLTGTRVNEDTFTVQIRDSTGGLHSLDKADIRKLDKLWGQSSMPSYRNISDDDLDDLVAYLATLRGD